jgi:hypothetical protein
MLVQAAVVSGATTFAAIRHWIVAAPEQVLADCEVRPARRTGNYRAPHPDTVSRLLEQIDPAELDAAYARHRAWQMTEELYSGDELIGLAVDVRHCAAPPTRKPGPSPDRRVPAAGRGHGRNLGRDGKTKEMCATSAERGSM